MAKTHFTKALFLLSILTINEVAVVAMRRKFELAEGQELKAKSRFEEMQLAESSKTPDKDWNGCKAWTESGCSKKEGCAPQKLWLDTWRQSCRYTDEYKLQRDQVAEFFPTELARLEEKSEIFAASGCITGGWWYKCYRRMQQILRLFNYVRKAKGIVVTEGESHPAYGIITSADTKQKFTNIANNLGTGCKKNKETKDLCVGEGISMLLAIPDKMESLKAEALEKGVELSEQEQDTTQQALMTAAILKITKCEDMTDEQVENLRAMVDATGGSPEVTPSAAPDDLDRIVEEQSEMMTLLDEDDRSSVRSQAQETDKEDVSEVDEHELESPNGESALQFSSTESTGNSSFLQLSSGDGPLKVLVKGGWKGMKWLVKNGVGWLFRRLVWTLVFLLSFTVSAVKAFVFWPILLVMCGSVRSVKWLFKDVLWDGKNIKKGFNKIGHCAPEMWDFVGFDSQDPSNGALAQVLMGPVEDASWVSGVYHPWRSGKPDPCRRVTCPQDTHCKVTNGEYDDAEKADVKCVCPLGKYSDTAGGCSLLTSTSGCQCRQYWKSWGVAYYGCSRSGECKVTKGCNKSLTQGLTERFFRATVGVKKTTDTCTPQVQAGAVPVLSIDTTLDAWGKKKEVK